MESFLRGRHFSTPHFLCVISPLSFYLLKGILVLLKAFNLVHFISFGVYGNFYPTGGEVMKNKNNLGGGCS